MFRKFLSIFKFKKKPPLKFLINSLDIFLKNISGAIHIGANKGQERDLYASYSVNVLWVEPIPDIYKKLKKNISKYPKQKAYQALLTDRDNQEITFNIASNSGQSSSILDLGQHKNIWPNIKFIKSIKLISSTLTSLIVSEKININDYQALILDTQGSELLILKGSKDILRKFKYIKTEAADFDAYINCCHLNDLSDFLKNYGFREIKKTKFISKENIGNYYDILYERSN
jgi:FkbM family methyltransferase